MDDDVFGVCRFLDCTDDFWLAGQLQFRRSKGLIHRCIPGRFFFGNAAGVVLRDSEVRQCLVEPNQCFAGIGDDWQLRAILIGIKRSHVDVDELDVRVLEHGARGGREIAITGTNTNDDIGITSDAVGSERAGGTHATEVLCVIPIQHTATGLRGAHRNAGLFRQLLQLLFCKGVQNAAAGDDHRVLCIADNLDGACQRIALRARATDVPLTVLEKFQRNVKSLSLDVFRQGNGDSTGLCRIRQDSHGR